MTELLKRIARIALARMPNPNRWLDRWAERRGYRPDPDGEETGKTRGNGDAGSRDPFPGVPRQVVEDLAVFGLTPPGSLDEVRGARNREIKKYHSDRFVRDAERYETSKHIMQIYNAAYDRLKAHFEAERGGSR